MTDSPRYGEMKPRPQYGEYASPQEQATAMGKSLPPISPVLMPHSGSPEEVASTRPDRTHDLAPYLPSVVKRSSLKPRRWDLYLTAALLAFAAWNVASQVFLAGDLSSVLSQFYTTQAIGTYTPTALAGTLGIVLNVSTIVLFVVTVYITSRLLRHGRIAFYVPLVGGVIAGIIALVFIVILVAGDPAFISYVTAKH